MGETNHTMTANMRAASARILQLPTADQIQLSSTQPREMSSTVRNLFRKYTTASFDGGQEAEQIQAMSVKRKQSRTVRSEQELFMELIYDIQHELDTEKLCFKILHNIAMLTGCDRSSLFLTRKDGDDQFLVCKIFDLTADSVYEAVKQDENDTFIIPFGTGILGHVAESKSLVKIDDAYQDDRFNRAIDDQTGYKTNSILCMPIMDSNSNVVGVAQIINKCDVDPSDLASHIFSDQDVLVFKKYLLFCGIGITNAQLFQLSVQEYRCNQLLLELARSIFKDSTDVNTLLERIMKQSLQIVDCQLCQVFLCDVANHYSFSSQFTLCDGQMIHTSLPSDNAASDTASAESASMDSFCRDNDCYQLIASHVYASGKTFSARNRKELQDKIIQRDLQVNIEESGLMNLISTPIKNAQEEIIAVVQMINKRDGVFVQADISAFEGFAIYCGLGIQNTRLYENMNRMHNFQKVCLEMLSYHSTVQTAEVQLLMDLVLSDEKKISLLRFEFDHSDLSDEETVSAVAHFYAHLGLTRSFSINTQTLIRWISSVKKNYRAVQFHNWRHAFSVAHAMFWLLSQPDIGTVITPLEMLVLLSSCLCHDLDHRGTNNAYQQKSNSPLAALHNTSTMEHHHFDMCIMILNTEGNNILESFPPALYTQVVSLLKHCILATDLSLHFKVRDELKKKLELNSDELDFTQENNKLLLMSLLMTSSDLCASAKPWSLQRLTAGCISEEFYLQGDKEKIELHEKPQEMMDREFQAELPKMQIGFFDNICLPAFKMLSPLFPSIEQLHVKCEENRENWVILRDASSSRGPTAVDFTRVQLEENDEVDQENDDHDAIRKDSAWSRKASCDSVPSTLSEGEDGQCLSSPTHQPKNSVTSNNTTGSATASCSCVVC